MSSTGFLRDDWTQRIAAQRGAVELAAVQLRADRHERHLAELALARAVAKVNFLKGCVELGEQCERNAVERLAHLRGEYLRLVLTDAVTDDVLRCIFASCAALPDKRWIEFGNGEFNPERARMPFVLSAVCRRWRCIALDMPELWTYISVPRSDAGLGLQVARVELLLRRSRTAPLDILLGLGYALEEERRAKLESAFDSIMTALNDHTLRFKRVELDLRGGYAGVLATFKGPLPTATHISLQYPVPEDEPGDVFFPHTPLLEVLRLTYTDLSLWSGVQSYPNLVSLDIDESNDIGNCDVGYLKHVLPRVRHTLQHLRLILVGDIPDFPIAFPRLLSLTLGTNYFFAPLGASTSVLEAPMLRSFGIDGNKPHTATHLSRMEPLIKRVAATVTELVLHNHLMSPKYYAPLRNVTHLVIDALDFDSSRDDLERSASHFFAGMAKSGALPRLQSIVFKDSELDDDDCNGILRLLRRRNLPEIVLLAEEQPWRTDTDDEEEGEEAEEEESVGDRLLEPSRIVEVVLWDGAPSGLVAEVERLVAIAR